MEQGTKLDDVVTSTGQINHLLSNNPHITRCGHHRSGGWWLSDADVPMCQQCTKKAPGGMRPLRDQIGKPIGAPLPKVPQDEHWAYLADKKRHNPLGQP